MGWGRDEGGIAVLDGAVVRGGREGWIGDGLLEGSLTVEGDTWWFESEICMLRGKEKATEHFFRSRYSKRRIYGWRTTCLVVMDLVPRCEHGRMGKSITVLRTWRKRGMNANPEVESVVQISACV